VGPKKVIPMKDFSEATLEAQLKEVVHSSSMSRAAKKLGKFCERKRKDAMC
jgi:hypothetical protein